MPEKVLKMPGGREGGKEETPALVEGSRIILFCKRRKIMMYEERILAYIDILGFTSAVGKTIEKNEETGKETENIAKTIEKNEEKGKETENIAEIQKIDNLLEEVRLCSYNREYLLGEPKIKGRVVSQFSDSLVISYLKESDIYHILLDIYFLCVMALEKGFLYRGAIVCGKVIHTDNKIFGPAFIDAHKIEEKIAFFPRILLDDKVIDIVKNNYSSRPNSDAEYNNVEKLILYDFDGKPFINYIDKLDTGVSNGVEEKQKHFLCINEMIENHKKTSDARIKCKYLWLKEKYECRLKKAALK